MCLIKQGIGLGLTLSLLVGCATTTDDPSHDSNLWEVIGNTIGGNYEKRAERQQQELEQSRREREQAEEESRRLKSEVANKRPNEDEK